MPVLPSPANFAAALEVLDAQLAQERTARNLPSLSVVIVHDHDNVWTRSYGYANLEAHIPATPHTTYRLNSITKLFTAMMLLQLRDAGKLQLDDPLTKYLPHITLHLPSADADQPTLRTVASHTAGLPNMPPMDVFRDPLAMMEAISDGTFAFPGIEAVLDSLHDTELVASPMASISYSNLGFALLGYVLERIADQPYQEYITEHILQPLGMTHSGFALPPPPSNHGAAANQFATHYVRTTPPVGAPSVAMDAFIPAGQLAASASDMAGFLVLHCGAERARHAPVLHPSTLREMHAPVVLAPDGQSGVGIGWFLHRLADQRVLSHGGAGHDGIAVIGIAPHHQLGVGLFTNVGAGSIDPGDLHRLTMDTLALLLSEC